MLRRRIQIALALGATSSLFFAACSPPVSPADVVTPDTQGSDIVGGDVQGVDAQGVDVQGVDAGGTDAQGSDAQVDAGPAMTYTYIINTAIINPNPTEPTSPAQTVAGFNLDGLFSEETDDSGCLKPDFYSPFDPDQHENGCAAGAGCKGGVDNQLPFIADTVPLIDNTIDVRASLSTAITNNEISLIVQLKDVNSFVNDTSVRVAVLLGYPTRTTMCDSVVSGGEYTVSASSLTAGATSVDQARYVFNGSIAGGRLRVEMGSNESFTLTLPGISPSGGDLSLGLRGTKLRMNVTATSGASGALGGWVDGQEAFAQIAMLAPDMADRFAPIIGSFFDIRENPTTHMIDPTGPTGVCNSSMPASVDGMDAGRRFLFGGLSAGLQITMVPATIKPTDSISASAPPGVCGTAP